VLASYSEREGGHQQRSLGHFPTPREAAEAFAAAARSQAAQPGRNGVVLRQDALEPILEEARQGGGLDILRVLRVSVREDLEDGHRERLATFVSQRSESGFKGVHKSGGGRWQTQACRDPAEMQPRPSRGAAEMSPLADSDTASRERRLPTTELPPLTTRRPPRAKVYFEGNLYHAGHAETPEACARIFSVCMKLVDKMKEDGSLAQASSRSASRTQQPAR